MGAYNDDVLFIHIPKTGGWSVKNWMIANLPGVLCPDPNNKEKTEKSKLPIGHIPLSDIARLTGRDLDSWQKIIGIIRNPYDQQVSQWNFWRDRYARGQRHVHDVFAAQFPSVHGWLEDKGNTGLADFHLWYEERFHNSDPWRRRPPGPERNYENFGGYYLYWLTVDGAIPKNVEIVKMEEMNEKLPELLQPYAKAKISKLKKENVSPRSEGYAEYYSHPDPEKAKAAIERVEQKFQWTFAQGHYPYLRFNHD